MPTNEIVQPNSNAPVDRMTLGVTWVRPSATGSKDMVNPAGGGSTLAGSGKPYCFE